MPRISSTSVLGVAAVLVLLSSQWIVFSMLSGDMSRIVPQVQQMIEEAQMSSLSYTHTDSNGKDHPLTTRQQEGESFDDFLDRHEEEIEKVKARWP